MTFTHLYLANRIRGLHKDIPCNTIFDRGNNVQPIYLSPYRQPRIIPYLGAAKDQKALNIDSAKAVPA
jgi:hypothetical protein